MNKQETTQCNSLYSDSASCTPTVHTALF